MAEGNLLPCGSEDCSGLVTNRAKSGVKTRDFAAFSMTV